MLSATDEAGVEGSGEGDVGGSLDETAAVGEEGEGVGWALETEEEIVEADFLNIAVGSEAVAHGGEVDGAMVLVDLYGVSAAEGDVRAADAGEVGELAVGADGAVRVGGAGIDFAAVYIAIASGCPKIEAEKGAAHEVGLLGEEFEGFSDLNGGG
jgi:hypothetical protein